MRRKVAKIRVRRWEGLFARSEFLGTKGMNEGAWMRIAFPMRA